MSQDIEDTPEPTLGFGVFAWPGWARGAGWLAGVLVVAVRVEGELAEEFAGGGADDPDVQVLDEEQDVGSGVGSADADVVEGAGVAEGEGTGGADAVGADAVVGLGGPVAGGWPWAGPCRWWRGWRGRERCGRWVL
jgi:hypothetical protein